MAIDSAPGAAAELLRTVPLPTFHPAIVGMVVGQDGTIWVQLGVQDASGRALWDVWSRDGTVFGRVALPERTYPLSIRAGQMVAKVESADGFQDVVKFRVQ
jgi:sugar lactone lactonase YvrE